MLFQTTIVTVVLSILSQCDAIAPADFTDGHLSSATLGRLVDHHSKRHVSVKEAMEQFMQGDEDAMQSRFRRADVQNGNESGGNPEFFTHEFPDQHNFALPVYTGIEKSEVIFLLTFDFTATRIVSHLYRSPDYGQTYENITGRVGNGASLQPTIVIGPANHRKIYLIDANAAIVYVSTDEGVTFAMRELSPSTIDPATITPHDIMDDWFMARDSINNALYVSRDLGSTPCIKIADDVTVDDRVQWGVHPYDEDMSTVYFLSNKVFYYQQYPYERENQKRFGDAVDFNDFLVIDRFIYLEYLANTSTTLYQLYMSADRQPFQEAKIPSRVQGHYQYIAVSVKANQALLINKHGNGEYILYASDETGVYFSESLASLAVIEIVPNVFYYIDLAVGMNSTTYVANQFVSGSNMKTLISFNAGGSWHPVTAPNGTECTECSLHFHIDTSDIWRVNVFNSDSAPGILVALGGVGAYFNSSLADLYMSTDGGFTWFLALEGLWQVDILDHGSIIVAAPYFFSAENGSTLLMYSCDEGLSWTPLNYTDTPVHVGGLRTEQGKTTTSLIVYGVHPNTTDWILTVIDFKNIFPSECEDDDYYNWTPYDEYAPNGCFLGAEVTIQRRKREVCCLNTHTYTRVVNYQICMCTLEDYRCDYGFRPINYDVNLCVRDYGVNFDDCVNGESYSRSLGYRKVSGNVCEGGIEDRFVPDNLTCSSSTNTGESSSSSYLAPFIVMLILFIIVLLAVVGLALVLIVCFVTHDGGSGGNKDFQHEHFTDTSSSLGTEKASKEMEAGVNL